MSRFVASTCVLSQTRSMQHIVGSCQLDTHAKNLNNLTIDESSLTSSLTEVFCIPLNT